MTDKIADKLRRAINRGMEGAGTLPAKEAVKVRPSDWHAIIDIASAAIVALDAKEAGGWQPIESAPKDGEAVLLYKPDERRVGEYIIAGYFGEWPGDGECWIACAGKPLGYFSEWQQAPQGYPTHWQPLPAPPSRLLNKEDRNG